MSERLGKFFLFQRYGWNEKRFLHSGRHTRLVDMKDDIHSTYKGLGKDFVVAYNDVDVTLWDPEYLDGHSLLIIYATDEWEATTKTLA